MYIFKSSFKKSSWFFSNDSSLKALEVHNWGNMKNTLKSNDYCFANIYGTKALILMKFHMVVNFCLVSLSFKFGEDPWINVRAWVVNSRIPDRTCVARLRLMRAQYCFANISATKDLIFMKFHMVVSYYFVSVSLKFDEDPCINAPARVVNARIRDKTCVRVFKTRALAFMQESSWNLKYELTR